MTHDVFISYSSQDKTVADAVCAKLESRKIRCWIAPRDVPPGKPYAASLINAINASKVVVLILSADSNKSVHVLREIGEAVNNGIPILPLRIEVVEPSEEMRYYIQSLHWLDALNPPRERQLEKLSDSVQALLGVDEDYHPVMAQLKEEPGIKRPLMPSWMKILFALLTIIILGGAGTWIYSILSHKSQSGASPPAAAGENEKPVNTPISTKIDGEWRTVSFTFGDEDLWNPYENNGIYAAKKQTSDTAFAWSEETIEGDFTLTVDITFDGKQYGDDLDDTCIILVYGDGLGWSYGNLRFLLGRDWHSIEKNLPFHQGEDFLGSNASHLDINGNTYHITVEVIDGIANLYVDDRKVVSGRLDEEVIQNGKIALEKFFDSRMGCTFSNIRIKTYGSN